jgi:UDP-N-acetylmuramoylalanine--D-glutamate ligase
MAESPQPDTVVLGLGLTGLSVARHLHAQGRPFAVADTRTRPPRLEALRALAPEAPLHLGPFDPSLLAGARRLIVSPGVVLGEAAIRQALACGVEVIGDVELFARAARAPVVAITGSNGKSTVTELMAEMARRAGRQVRAGGNLGPPALDLLQGPEPELYVLELSSFQLETLHSLRPKAAVVLNLSADHLDRHGDLQRYAATKARVYRGAERCVVNRDEPRALAAAGHDNIGFGLDHPSQGHYGLCTRAGEVGLARGSQWLLGEGELRITGRHNLANALAALALGEAVGLDLTPMLDALRGFAGLAHRTQWVAEHRGVRWYNDSKGTNVGATLAALEGLPGPVVLIAGGVGKGADFTVLRAALARKARAVVLMGRDARLIAGQLRGAVPLSFAEDMRAAVAQAAQQARAGDSVLLSPACASFDMYRDYAQRGEAFMGAVREWIA